MAGRDENRDAADPFSGYEPTRAARLRWMDGGDGPPPVPQRTSASDLAFGSEEEDGLRMLAALETLTSLEPDYSDDLAAEASVTIIDAAGYEIVAAAFSDESVDPDPIGALLDPGEAGSEPALLLNGYESFLGPGDEAIVEIVEVAPDANVTAPEADRGASTPQPASLTERLAAATGPGGRFLKALSGG